MLQGGRLPTNTENPDTKHNGVGDFCVYVQNSNFHLPVLFSDLLASNRQNFGPFLCSLTRGRVGICRRGR